MTTRRGFLSAVAGIAFCSCGLLDAAQAQRKKAALPVMVNGKRVKTIDIHAHCLFHDAVDMMGEEASRIGGPVKGAQQVYLEAVDERLKAMDAMAVDMEVLSINPFWYKKDRDTAAKIVDLQNEKLAELCGAHPDRFAAFGSLALQHPDLAVAQLETAVKKYGLRGAAIGGTVAGENFSDAKFHPVWAKAEELGATLFIHPQSPPELTDKLKGNGWLQNTVGLPTETTIALSHLIFQGTLDKFPKLKVLSAHGGGYLPSYADRSDHACFVNPAGCDPNITLKKKPTEYLKQLYFDALVFTPEALRHLAAQVGTSQIMLGSDHPYPWEDHPVDAIMATVSLSAAEKAAILSGNAARVLGIKKLI